MYAFLCMEVCKILIKVKKKPTKYLTCGQKDTLFAGENCYQQHVGLSMHVLFQEIEWSFD